MVLAESTLRLAPILPVLPHDTPSPTPLPPESPGVREHRGLQLVLPQLFAYLGKIASPAEFLHPPVPFGSPPNPQKQVRPTSNNRPHRQPPLISSLVPARLADIVNCTFRLSSPPPDTVQRRCPSRPNPPEVAVVASERYRTFAIEAPTSLLPSPFPPPHRPQCLLESYVAPSIFAAAQLPGTVPVFCGIPVDLHLCPSYTALHRIPNN